MKGIEPSYAAWEAAVLPLNYTRDLPDFTGGYCDQEMTVGSLCGAGNSSRDEDEAPQPFPGAGIILERTVGQARRMCKACAAFSFSMFRRTLSMSSIDICCSR